MPRSQMSFMVRENTLGMKGETKQCCSVENSFFLSSNSAPFLTDICNSSLQGEYLHLQKKLSRILFFMRAVLLAFTSTQV